MKIKGVYTIEAAIYVPLVMVIMTVSIKIAIALYTEVRTEASSYSSVLAIDEVKTIHKIRTVGNFWEEIKE